MQFRIAHTFTNSLAKLTNDEQKRAKQTAFDFQVDPVGSGKSFERITSSKDSHFWSVRVSRDLRMIVHKTGDSMLLCYVDHHDQAYAWAHRRRLETHPKTGAAQFVEIRETVLEIEKPKEAASRDIQTAPHKIEQASVLAGVGDEQLLSYGVPQDWLETVKAADEDRLLDIADHLPAEAAEALLALAVGETPAVVDVHQETDPFEHPDAQRRFRLVASTEELQQALDYPWDQWAVFLHPTQRQIVESEFNGPARVLGSAGTGKTIVALHRSVELARRYENDEILLTTFSITLARMLRQKLARLVGQNQLLTDRIKVRSIDEVGLELYENAVDQARVATPGMIRTLLQQASDAVSDHRFSMKFLLAEWHDIVDPWQIQTWKMYRDVVRLGRKTRLGEKQRQAAWQIFSEVIESLHRGGLVTMAYVFAETTRQVNDGVVKAPMHILVDEAQDIKIPQLRFLASVAGDTKDGLFFSGDLGQQIFQMPFSWKSLGVDVRGRSQTLKVNYRTSHQIRQLADKLLAANVSDVDGLTDERRGTISAFNGPHPSICIADSEINEQNQIAAWLKERTADGLLPHEVAVFVRSENEISRASAAVREAKLSSCRIQSQGSTDEGSVAIGLMHDAKGLEFKAVVVAACDDDIVPSHVRINSVGDEADLESIYESERHLLYVACTRARDHLLVSGISPGSEFIEDFETDSC